jgi:uncharacterized Zn finger protein
MSTAPHPLLESISKANFEEASVHLQELRRDLKAASLTPADTLALIKAARENALVQRAQLLKSLSRLEASQLFTREGGQPDPTWSLEA